MEGIPSFRMIGVRNLKENGAAARGKGEVIIEEKNYCTLLDFNSFISFTLCYFFPLARDLILSKEMPHGPFSWFAQEKSHHSDKKHPLDTTLRLPLLLLLIIITMQCCCEYWTEYLSSSSYLHKVVCPLAECVTAFRLVFQEEALR